MKMVHKTLPKLLFLLVLLFTFHVSRAADVLDGGDVVKGKELFTNNCTSCHKLGEVLVGPDLIGVKTRWADHAKLIAWVKSSSTVLASGDAYANGLFAKFNKVAMPPQPLTEAEIKDVLAYANVGDAPAGGGGAAKPTGAYVPVPEEHSLTTFLLAIVIILLLVIISMASGVLTGVAKLHNQPMKGANLDRINAILFPIFLVVWFVLLYLETNHDMKKILPTSASDTGAQIDKLMIMTTIITGFVFIVCQIALFWFAYKYRGREGKKAYFYPHNNTLEFIWTIIPAIALAAMVTYGFKTWRKATDNPGLTIAQQATFDRISLKISNKQPLSSAEQDSFKILTDIMPFKVELFAKQFDWTFRYPGPDGKLGRVDFRLMTDDNPLGIDWSDPASHDDIIENSALHIPLNKEVYFKLRSRDVTHDAYFPHFRAQMYVQPGMDNHIRFTPIISTDEMRVKVQNPAFNYELACNQLCGASHFNMRRTVFVDTDAEYAKWLAAQKPAYTGQTNVKITAMK